MTHVPVRMARSAVVALFATGVLLLLAGSASAATYAGAEERLVAEINRSRAQSGLPTLAVDVQLTRVARDWTEVMVQRDSMEHNPRLGEVVKGDWTRLGENIGWTQKSPATQDELVDRLNAAFMASPKHKDNVLGDWNSVGVGVVTTSGGKMWATVNFMKSSAVRPAGGQIAEAAAVSRSVFAAAGTSGRNATHAVVGRAEVFADTLGGAALAGDRAPVLFTSGPTSEDPQPVLSPTARAEIDRVLGGKGTVYLLGGASAVSDRVAHELAADGYDVRRLSGPTRIETSVRVAREVLERRGSTGEVLIARADDWADAVTGGAYAASTGSPVLLTGGDTLHPAVAAFLDDVSPRKRWALGGTAALSDRVVAAADAKRIAGPERTATGVAVAKELWGRTEAHSGDAFSVAPGFSADGWAYALAYAPWAAANAGPQILVGDSVSPAVEEMLSGLGYSGSVRADVNAASPVPQPVVDRLRHLTGN